MLSLNASEIPHTWYNISEQLGNDTMFVGDTASLVIPEGQYIVWELCSAITDYSSMGWNFDAIFQTKTSKVKFTNNGSDATLSFSGKESTGVAKVLDFNLVDSLVLSGAVLEAQGVINLNTIHSVVVNTSLPVINALSTTDNDIITPLGKIPVNTNYDHIINFDSFNNLSNSKITLDSVNGFEITLNDQNGKAIDFNNVNYEISLLFEIRDKPKISLHWII